MKTFRNAVALVTFIISLAAAHAQSWLTNGLVAYYPCSGNANDASGNGINGVLNNVLPTTGHDGIPSGALSFQATNGSYVDFGSPLSLQFTGDFTLTAWVNFSGGTLNPRIISYGADYGNELYTVETNGVRHFGVNLGGIKFGTSQTFAPNVWHFVSSRRQGSNVIIFVDGNFIVTNAVSAVPIYSGNLNFGRKSLDGFDNYWDGAIDDVRFYNRAFSDSELQQLFAYESFCSPHRATALALLTNGVFIGATMLNFGCGYTNTPSVFITGGGGSGATATAVVSNGFVVGINVTSGGCCYTNLPKISIESPPFVPTVAIAVSKVKVTQHLRVNHNYVLEASSDLKTWTATAPQFTAESESVASEFDVDTVGRYFRLREVP